MDVLIFLPVLLFSVVLHEVAHAWVARREGDDTAERLGRITLNPIPHLDLMGSIIVPLVLFFLPGQFLFGWAKPVPVNPANYRNYVWGDIRVSLAGIVSNLLLATLCTGLFWVVLTLEPMAGGTVGAVLRILQQMAFYGLFINLILAFFNLIPIPPLDGSHVVFHLLPRELALKYREFGKYGIGVLMLLVFFFPNALSMMLWPVEAIVGVVYRVMGF